MESGKTVVCPQLFHSRIGITTVTGKNYTQQFGLSLATHTAVPIDDGKSISHLMAATGEAVIEIPDGSDLTAEQEAQLWAVAQPLFDQLKTSNEDSAMWIPDLRDTGLLAGAAAAVVAVSPVQAADNYVFGVCRTANSSVGAEIRPTYAADSYLTTYHRNDPRYKGFTFDSDDAKVTLIKAPAHGKVVLEEGQWSGNADYHYWPKTGYVGKDRFVMQVEKNGVKVRIQYLIEDLAQDDPETYIGDDGERHDHYCNPEHWKISSSFTTPYLDNARLQSLLDATGINNSVTVDKWGQTTVSRVSEAYRHG